MNRLSVKKGQLIREVIVPSSKSYANRALILATLQKKPYRLIDVPDASDVTILIECLKKIGVSIETQLNGVKVVNSFPECEKDDHELDVGEGGTTARFLAAMLLLGKKTYRLRLGERLRQRPWQGFITLAKNLGADVGLSDGVLTLKGPITFPKVLEVDCSETTQFATAFQLMAPPDCKIIPLHLKASESYWKMTEEIIQIVSRGHAYVIPKDWSSSSYPMAFAALNHEIIFPQLKIDHFQADSKFVEILKNYKAVTEFDDGLRVHPGIFSGELIFDVSDCLDLVPTLAYFLAHIEGKHILKGVKNLVHKESNRLVEVMTLLEKFGRETSTDGESLVITGHRNLVIKEIDLELPNDHRLVMAGTLFLLHHSGGSVTPMKAVSKSYPDFFELIRR